ncbi:6-hydroxymethylpterin diphosphokinase MptE-like protein [Thalassotalea hakodatensis]|uniref:6-hydroxymethylpterin diphosphokinase MptE-like protein n=1 Tax=Thalassotalea hakodatensis TaxID=3030492 RepID=UPI002573243B|nr:6-hydroxymethylpterin diphosphokinase MptE-like protein [Thalassotalea hakodatensis]
MQINDSFLTSQFGEEYLYLINRNAFEKQPSHAIFENLYDEKLHTEERFYIILGTDSGLLLDHVVQLEKPVDTRYLFIELPEVIERLEHKNKLDELPEYITITTIDKWKDSATAFGMDLYLYKDYCQFIKSVAAIDSFVPAYNAAILQFEQEFQSYRFITRATLGVSPFMSPQLMNICENQTPALVFKHKFKGDTCIILAGGPSLDEDIEWVKKHKDHIVIIAVSRIARRLNQIGLIPHIVVSVDPYEISYDVSKELLLFPPNVLFLHSNSVTPFLLAQWHGKSAYLNRRYPWDEKGDEKNLKSAGPTVTNTALKAAVDMGFSNILLSGVDLCFSEKGVTHASGSNEANIGPTLGRPGTWVKTYAGKTVETLIVFGTAGERLSEIAEEAKKTDQAVYNLSPNAACLPHIEHVPSSALSFTHDKENYADKLLSCIPVMTTSEIQHDYNVVNTNVKRVLADVKDIKRLAEKALTANEQLFKEKGNESENFKFKIQMDKIEKKLNTTFKRTSKFIKNFGIDKFISSAQANSSDEWSDDKVEKTGKLYYQAYIVTCENLIILLDKALERINSRIEEQKPTPRLSIMFAQWEKDRILGRAQHWLEKTHVDQSTFTSEEQSTFERFAKIHTADIHNVETKHLTRTKEEASLDGVRRKVITLFHQKNIDALTTLMNSLKISMETEEQAKVLYNLGLAYSSILTESYQDALYYFEQLPPEHIEEDELQQLAGIAYKLKDYDLAKACLQELSVLSITYLPQFTKLLRLLGDEKIALNYFHQCIEQDPKNVFLWNGLGEFYFNGKAYDSAKIAFETALSNAPDDKRAKEFLQKLNALPSNT